MLQLQFEFHFAFLLIQNPEFKRQYLQSKIYFCTRIEKSYPEEAKGFADEDAKQEDLDLAIDSITKAFWNPDDSSLRDYDYFDWAEDESRITADLTQCYEARKVYFFGYYNCNLTFILLFCLSLESGVHTPISTIQDQSLYKSCQFLSQRCGRFRRRRCNAERFESGH